MRILVPIILSLLIVSSVVAQPRIDSMWVDESIGNLRMSGWFSAAPDSVTCDKISLHVIAWADTEIVASIPDSGKGSAGAVVVTSADMHSKPALLSRWQILLTHDYTEWTTKPYVKHNGIAYRIIWRYDIESLLRGGRAREARAVTSTRESKRGTISESNVYISNTKRATPSRSTQEPVILHLLDHIADFPTLSYSNIPTHIEFDSALQVVNGYSQHDGPDPMISTDWTAESSSFLPSVAVQMLLRPPILLSPPSGSVFATPQSIVLSWKRLFGFDSVVIELSTDSLFRTFIDRVAVSGADSTFTTSILPTDKIYYWRISASNQEGVTPSSDVWSFLTGTNAGVRTQGTQTANILLSPNPADKYITVVLPNAGSHEVSVYDMLGRRLEQIAVHASPSLQIEVSGLADGPYFIVVDHTSRAMLRVEHGSR